VTIITSFGSHVMLNFQAEWEFRLTTSSPSHAQSNGQREGGADQHLGFL